MKNWLFALLSFLIACSSIDVDSSDDKDYAALNMDQLGVELNEANQRIREDVNNGDLYIERSKIYMTLGDIQAAMADVDRAMTIDPNAAEYYQQKGELMIRSRDFSQTELAFKKCAQLNKENTACRLKLAELYFYSQRNKDAMRWANEVLKVDKYDADAYFLKGMIHLVSGDTSLAESSLQTAVEQNPDHFDAYFQLGLLFQMKMDPLGIEYYNNAIRISPERVEPYYNKGLLSQELGDYNVALKSYSDLLKIDPNYKDAHFNMGYINMFYLKQYKQGAVHFNNAIRVAPDYYQAYYNRGYCYELLGDVKRALIDYENALKINPGYTLAAQGKERVVSN